MTPRGHMPSAIELAGHGLDKAGDALTRMVDLGVEVLPQFYGLGEAAVVEARRIADAGDRGAAAIERATDLALLVLLQSEPSEEKRQRLKKQWLEMARSR